MVHRWPSTHNKGPDTILIVSFILIGLMIVTQIFYIFYMKYSYQSVKRSIIRKGRLLQLLPVVTVSTVLSTEADNSSNVLATQYQPTAPTASYQTDPSTSTTYKHKEVPPPYTY